MAFENIISELALIFAGAACLASIFLYLRQPVIVAYIALGMLVGPFGFKLIHNVEHIEAMSHIGIVFLLFLIGLNLPPKKLLNLFKKSMLITVLTCALFSLVITGITYLFGFSVKESIIVGLALMFSSTVIGLKLIPTTALHLKYIGEVMISVLLLQDIIAILLLIFLGESGSDTGSVVVLLLILKALLFVLAATFVVRFLIFNLFKKFDIIQEFIFVLSLGWCFLTAYVADSIGLSYEIGAFVGGCTLATLDVSLVISEHLKPLREFFLILFFFAIGSQLDFLIMQQVFVPGIVIALVIIVLKPLVYNKAFKLLKEDRKIYRELSLRLGQASEFALLIAYAALARGVIGDRASFLIQTTVILTMIISTYIITLKLQTPITKARFAD